MTATKMKKNDWRAFTCQFCERSFSNHTNLKAHRRTHTGEKPFKCRLCNYEARLKNHLMVHVRIHTGEKPYTCDFEGCNHSAVSTSSLRRHKLSHNTSKEKIFACDLCNYAGTNILNLRSHKKHAHNPNPKVHGCPHCPSVLKSERNLNGHISRVHSDKEGWKIYSCPQSQCSYTTKLKGDLRQHYKRHDVVSKILTCPHGNGCDYQTHFKATMVTHQKVHTMERPFGCPFCEYRGKDRQSLNSHIKRHTGEKPFKCPKCLFTAKTSHQIKTHEVTHEVVRERNFSCQICDYKAMTSTSLKIHQAVHRSEKAFPCSIETCSYRAKSRGRLAYHEKSAHLTLVKRLRCSKNADCGFKTKYKGCLKRHEVICTVGKKGGKNTGVPCPVQGCTFKTGHKEYLAQHLRRHSEVKPYECKLCEYRCKFSSSLTAHISRRHSDEKPFKCGLCPASYRGSVSLHEHMRRHTGEMPFVCPVKGCQYKSVSYNGLKGHKISSHSREKRFVCPICQVAFAIRTNLAAHQRVHSEERPWVCYHGGCPFVSKYRMNLKTHLRVSHKDFGWPPPTPTPMTTMRSAESLKGWNQLRVCSQCNFLGNDKQMAIHLNDMHGLPLVVLVK